MRFVVRTLACAIAVLFLSFTTQVNAQQLSVPADAQANIAGSKSTVYIVQLEENPAVAYDGDIKKLKATRPAKGSRFNRTSGAVRRYVAHLTSRHDDVLSAVGAVDGKIYSYVYSFNGFAAVLSGEQAVAIAAMPGVLAVSNDIRKYPDTDNSPSFIGVAGGGGLWDLLGGQGMAGEDVIIGVIDTGIWPEHPSFSDQVDLSNAPGSSGKRTRAYDAPRRIGTASVNRESNFPRTIATTS